MVPLLHPHVQPWARPGETRAKLMMITMFIMLLTALGMASDSGTLDHCRHEEPFVPMRLHIKVEY